MTESCRRVVGLALEPDLRPRVAAPVQLVLEPLRILANGRPPVRLARLLPRAREKHFRRERREAAPELRSGGDRPGAGTHVEADVDARVVRTRIHRRGDGGGEIARVPENAADRGLEARLAVGRPGIAGAQVDGVEHPAARRNPLRQRERRDARGGGIAEDDRDAVARRGRLDREVGEAPRREEVPHREAHGARGQELARRELREAGHALLVDGAVPAKRESPDDPAPELAPRRRGTPRRGAAERTRTARAAPTAFLTAAAAGSAARASTRRTRPGGPAGRPSRRAGSRA